MTDEGEAPYVNVPEPVVKAHWHPWGAGWIGCADYLVWVPNRWHRIGWVSNGILNTELGPGFRACAGEETAMREEASFATVQEAKEWVETRVAAMALGAMP